MSHETSNDNNLLFLLSSSFISHLLIRSHFHGEDKDMLRFIVWLDVVAAISAAITVDCICMLFRDNSALHCYVLWVSRDNSRFANVHKTQNGEINWSNFQACQEVRKKYERMKKTRRKLRYKYYLRRWNNEKIWCTSKSDEITLCCRNREKLKKCWWNVYIHEKN